MGRKTEGAKDTSRLTTSVEMRMAHGKRMLHALIDCGAEENFLSQRWVVEQGLRATSSTMAAKTIDDHKVVIYGEHMLSTAAIDSKGVQRESQQKFYACDMHAYDMILGWTWLRQMNPDCHWDDSTWYYREQPHIVAETARQFQKTLQGETCVYAVYISVADSMSATELSIMTTRLDDTIPLIPTEYKDYVDVFDEDAAARLPTQTHTTHAIELVEGSKVPYGPIYHLSELELRTLREYLADSENKGWIRKSKSPAGAPILFVPKKDGSLRLCVDYRALNKLTVKNRYALPLINETIDRLSGAKFYTKLDLKDAYHRIRIKPGDEWKTAFRTRYGHFEYAVMPFGLTNAPATFQAYVNEALAGLLDITCVAFMDDICIYSDTAEEHAERVRQVLDRLRTYGLYCKLSKCEFSVSEISFLGYVIGVEGVSMDPRKVQTILDWPVPESYRDIQVFLGFANFYRRFITHYSRVAKDITDLLLGMEKGRKTGPFVWTDSAQHAFSRLKELFTTAPILQHYDPSRRTRVETDASGFALSGVLSQFLEVADEWGSMRGAWHPIAFWSRKLTATEKNYSTSDAELLAIVEAFREWRPYLEGIQHTVEVITDHENLKYFMTTKALNRRQAHWAEDLAAFDFNITWRKGSLNPADAPSRRPDYEKLREDRDQTLLPTLQNKLKCRRQLIRDQYAEEPAVGTIVTVAAVLRSQARKKEAGEKHATSQSPSREPTTESIEQDETPGLPQIVLRRDVNEAMREMAPLDPPEESRTLVDIIRMLQGQDVFCSSKKWKEFPDHKILIGDHKGKWSEDHAGLVRREGCVYVPRNIATRQEILRLNHDNPWQGGHFGVTRTLETLSMHYWWPTMRQDIQRYVASCDTCQRMKAPRHKPYGLLTPLDMPTRPWEAISLDFITGLPPAGRRGKAYDAILVVVCRYTKMMRCIACTTTISAPELAERLYEEIISKVGMPASIVSDRGSIFTSKWWGTFCYFWNMKRRFSTAFHPQTDGQTERHNQTLESYLRCYVNYQQDDWTRMLPACEYAYNSSRNATTGKTPFEMVLTFRPTMRLNPESKTETGLTGVPGAQGAAEKLARDVEEHRERWLRVQKSSKEYYDAKHKERSYRIGTEVLLSSKNIAVRKPCKKLTERFLGPFIVEASVGPNAYRLRLPSVYGRLHHTFHVSLLEPYHRREGVEPPPPTLIDAEQQWEVERILDEKKERGKVTFFIRWKDYTPEHDSWEPEENVEGCEELIEEFRAQRQVASGIHAPKLRQGKDKDRRGVRR